MKRAYFKMGLYIFLLEYLIGIVFKYFESGSISLLIFKANIDMSEIFLPVDMLVKTGTYSQGENNIPFAGRMPGYIFPYLIFRLIFNKSISLYLLGIFQLILKSISAILIHQIIYNITKSVRWAHVALFIYVFIPYFGFWDYICHPNSTSVSIYVILLYSLYNFKDKASSLTWIGILMTYLFFMRPFLFVYLLPISIYIFYHLNKNQSYVYVIKRISIFFIPLLFFESMWVIRNYISLKKFIPFQSAYVSLNYGKFYQSVDYTDKDKTSLIKVRALIHCWGGETFWYFPGEKAWFCGKDNNFIFPPYVYTKSISIDSLLYLKQLIFISLHNDFDTKKKDSIENKIIEVTNRYIKYYKKEKPLDYWIFSKFRVWKTLLFKNITQDWPGYQYGRKNIVYLLLKIISIIEYTTLWISFLFVLIKLIFQMNKISSFEWLLISHVFILLFSFAFLINALHYNYLITTYASILILVCCVLGKNYSTHTTESMPTSYTKL